MLIEKNGNYIDSEIQTRGRWWVEEGPQTPEEFDEMVRAGELIVQKVTPGLSLFVKSELVAGWFRPYWLRFVTTDDGLGKRTLRAVRPEDYVEPSPIMKGIYWLERSFLPLM